MSLFPLHDGWTVRPVHGRDVPTEIRDATMPATVPGCVHTDLLSAGLIPDPYLDDNEAQLSWIGRTDWAYENRFDWSTLDTDRIDLVCDGLDTVATVTLNGVQVGTTVNMHRTYRFDLRPALRTGGNTLRVVFESAYTYAEALRDRLGQRPGAYPEPYNFIRKTASNFGWDWGPTLVTAGIWRPIGLHAWSTARLATIRPLCTVDGDTGVVDVHVDLARTGAEPLVLTASVGGQVAHQQLAAGQLEAVVRLQVPQVARWRPRGLGDQPRYEVSVTLSTLDGTPLDAWHRNIGFRTVRLDTTPDEHGTPFTLHVNDVPVFVRGVNWIPDDVFPNRVSRDRLRTRLTQAVDANVNYVRVWGGGNYESDDFYDLADELGLLVGQDFLFACAAYPEDEPFRTEVELEARNQVVRLSPHPSLVLWTGNNENIQGYADWGWRDTLDGRSWGAGYYFDLLPSVVAELDPTRPYWPGSPYSGTPDAPPNDPAHGTTHVWDVWNTRDYTHYRSFRPRFVAEFGFQGPAAFATLHRAITDRPLTADSPGMATHQKAVDGLSKLARVLAEHLPPAGDFDDWHYLTQVNQARAVQLGIEHFRSLRPLCMGTIVWQFNDCWPVVSWSAVDGDGRRKPLWHALRRAYADRVITLHPAPDRPILIAVNDAAGPWRARLTVARIDFAGEPRARATVDVEVPAGSRAHVPLPAEVVTPDDPYAELIVVGGGGDRAVWFFAEDRDLALPAPEWEATVARGPGQVRVDVTARTLLRDLTLYPDRLDPAAEVDTALVTLLPGETVTFTVRTRARLDPWVLVRRPVLRCVNDVATGTRRTTGRPADRRHHRLDRSLG